MYKGKLCNNGNCTELKAKDDKTYYYKQGEMNGGKKHKTHYRKNKPHKTRKFKNKHRKTRSSKK